jgi:tetratricopeptide (TPR) repeat protein
MLGAAFQMRALDRAGDAAGAGLAWKQALNAVATRSDWLEILGRTMVAWGSPERAEDALWKLAENGACPPWAIELLWTSAEKKRDTVHLYKASKLRLKADPTNFAARTTSIRLALLTGREADSSYRLAEALYSDNPISADAAVTYGLSLYLRGRLKEAIAALVALRPEQLHEPRVAFYYGIFLAAAGQSAKADEYLRVGAALPLLPEEEVMLAKARSVEQVGAVR